MRGEFRRERELSSSTPLQNSPKILMELNFDKEMDALLRQRAGAEIAAERGVGNGGPAAASDARPHLDADEFSAFAANALPGASRLKAIEHLADCGQCRTVLSNIALRENKDPILSEPTVVASTVGQPSFIEQARSWFAFPKLAYTMAALALVFSGVVAFVVLRGGGNGDLAQMTPKEAEKAVGAKGAASDGDDTSASEPMPREVNSNASGSAANAATNSGAANSTAPGAPAAFAANSSANAPANAAGMAAKKSRVSSDDSPADIADADEKLLREKTKEDAKRDTAADTGLGGTVSSAKSNTPPAPVTKVPGAPGASLEDYAEKNRAQAQVAQNQMNNEAMSPDSARVMRKMPAPAKRAPEPAKDERENSAPRSRAETAPTRSVGGKDFRREGSVWIDTAYRGQATQNINRGTDAFSNLDSGLRSIANNLGGTVVVVWKSKAYRIQ
jgi:hypothetical protein